MLLLTASEFRINFFEVNMNEDSMTNPVYLRMLQTACMWSNKENVNTTMVADSAENALLLCKEEFVRKLNVIISKESISKDIMTLFNPSHISFLLGGLSNYAQASNSIKPNSFIQFNDDAKLYKLDSTEE